MRKASLFIFLLIGIFFLSEFPVDAARGISVISDLSHQSGKLGAYRALIIGINDYKDPKIPDLETAVNDAKTMAKLLRERYGFKVKLILDRTATRKTIYNALRNLSSTTKPADSVLIYYAGHGDLDRTYDDGWWIPADAKGGDPVTYLDNVQVQKSMRSMKARHVLLISDSCYSGTLFGQARAMPQVIDNKYYLNLYNEKSRWGMTSGNKTPVSDTGSGGHSIFAYQLIKELRKNEKPYISTQEIYTRIAPIVANNSEQAPVCRPIRNTGDQGGEFVFVASSGAVVAQRPQAKTQYSSELKKEREKLERERQELERLKMEIEREKLAEERKRLEAEKKKVAIAKKEIGRDGTLIAYATGVVYDKNTGLEWYAGPNRTTNWYQAKRWVESLNVAGGGWRMPTRKELKTLYKRGAGTRNMTPLLKTTGWWIWSGEKKRSSAWGFLFSGSGHKNRAVLDYSKNARGFAVRSRRYDG
jgi:uncharacterized caspase-like protein